MEEEKDKRIADAIRLMYSFLPNKPKYIRDVLVTDIFTWLEKQSEKQKLDGTFVNVDEVRESFMNTVYSVLSDDPTNDRVNDIINAFDSLPTIKYTQKTMTAVNVPTVAYITDDNRLSVSVDLNTLKGYETLKNGIKNSSDRALVQQALDRAKDLANTIEGALAGKTPYPNTYYRMCQEIIECLTKINKIV